MRGTTKVQIMTGVIKDIKTKNTIFLALIIISTLLTACAPAIVTAPEPVPVKVPEVPKKFVLISSKPEPTPGWVDNGTYEDTEKFLYFVGTSGERHAEERDALEKARIDASNKFVEYCGVDAKVFSNYIESLDDVLSSQLQDETISGTSGSTQKSEAYFSRLKTSKRYVEKYERNPGEYAYKIKVLVNVPREEYYKVQKWKRQLAAKKQQRAAEQILNTYNAIEGLINNAKTLSKEGNVLGALNHFYQARTIATESSLPNAIIFVTNIEKEERLLTGSIQLKILQNPSQLINVGQTPKPLVASVTLKNKESKEIPVSGFPLLVERTNYGTSETKTRVTNFEGKLEINLPAVERKGLISIRLAPDKKQLGEQIQENVLKYFSSQDVLFRIEAKCGSLQKTLALIEANNECAETTVKSSDFSFQINTSSASSKYNVGAPFKVFAKCAVRCYTRLFHIGPDESVSVVADIRKKLLKNKRKSFEVSVPDAGRHRFVGIASTNKIAGPHKAGVGISAESFLTQLRAFRLSEGKQASFQITLDVVK